MPIRPVSSLSLYLSRLERGFGGLFVDLLRRWCNRSRFCTKAKAAPPPAEEEAPAKPVEGVAQGDEQTEAPEPPGIRGNPGSPPSRLEGPGRPNWTIRGMSLNDDASRAGGGGYARLARRAVPNQRQRTLFCGSGYFLNG